MATPGAIAASYRLAPRWTDRIVRRLVRWSSRGSSEYQLHREAVRRSLSEAGCLSADLLEAISDLPAEILAEHLLFRFASQSHLLSLQGDIAGVGLSALKEELKRRKGLILGCTHIGVFYHAILQLTHLQNDLEVLIVSGNENYDPGLVARLSEPSGTPLRVADAATGASLAVARHLRKGGIVATMLDFYVESALPVSAAFFGRMASTPAGIFQLAVRGATGIAPIAVVADEHGRRQVIVDSIIEAGSNALDLATRVNARVEAMIRRHPAAWGAWPTLTGRWASASALAGAKQ